MTIVLMRHADAGKPDPRRYPDDRLRPLTAAGEERHRIVAGALARAGIRPTQVLTSPLLRARRTAEITAQALGHGGEIRPTETLADGFSVPGMLAELADYADDTVVLCVGHEPHCSTLAAALVAGGGVLGLGLDPSGVIGIAGPAPPVPGSARLLFVLPPGLLLHLA